MTTPIDPLLNFDSYEREELIEVVMKLLYENNSLHSDNNRLRITVGQQTDEIEAQRRQITRLECKISTADETALRILIEARRASVARAHDASLARYEDYRR